MCSNINSEYTDLGVTILIGFINNPCWCSKSVTVLTGSICTVVLVIAYPAVGLKRAEDRPEPRPHGGAAYSYLPMNVTRCKGTDNASNGHQVDPMLVYENLACHLICYLSKQLPITSFKSSSRQHGVLFRKLWSNYGILYGVATLWLRGRYQSFSSGSQSDQIKIIEMHIPPRSTLV